MYLSLMKIAHRHTTLKIYLPNTSVKLITQGEKLILPETSGIRIVSDTEDSIDTTISFVEIS